MVKEQCKCPLLAGQVAVSDSTIVLPMPLTPSTTSVTIAAPAAAVKPTGNVETGNRTAKATAGAARTPAADCACESCGESPLECVCPERLETLVKDIRVHTKIPDRLTKMLELMHDLHGQIGRGESVKQKFLALEQRGKELLKQHEILAAHVHSGAVKAPVMASHLKEIDVWLEACDGFNVDLCLHGSVVICEGQPVRTVADLAASAAAGDGPAEKKE